jgi:5-(carboxyamino)imidazole ribonucleotide mutase
MIKTKKTAKTKKKSADQHPEIAIVMGSRSDWTTMKFSAETLQAFDVAHECGVVSAHRTPEHLFEFARTARDRGIKIIIAGAGGAAHLPGMLAAMTDVPVLGVPVQSKILNGVDSLLSIVQMPAGIPVSTFAIGEAGAKNAALAAISMLATIGGDEKLQSALAVFRKEQTRRVLQEDLSNL